VYEVQTDTTDNTYKTEKSGKIRQNSRQKRGGRQIGDFNLAQGHPARRGEHKERRGEGKIQQESQPGRTSMLCNTVFRSFDAVQRKTLSSLESRLRNEPSLKRLA
jgi:hypothetical protein